MADVTQITSGTLIAAERVNGTNVYNPAGEKLGSVEDIMLDKVSGRAIYAIMSFGGFLGIGRVSNGESLVLARIERAFYQLRTAGTAPPG